ncbi:MULTISPECIES: nucleotidyltransferase family protein [Pseudomonas syringae group genomosp. 2]|uniref:nucleotidyltransferase family protein n=1 Tax=Pseudomonas syringae group genomosp. 2 TaxID=251698 RepID=UPI0001CC0EA6|nr:MULTISPECIES: nucleotidyltransferase family protein [Pseudomonas syringae group genomosp. 2]EGH05005.1 phage integrase [Pseudomonas amygdali pv. aesculi str. 0893_23]KWT14017.1 integrase [Pseudomonas amygdali pv. aesculi]KWT17178.1 integrase [Pseudomonas amygdali pv. aesculi]KWT20418.1 integrase [Pseudomonas amygdali pv. aesculi]KWT26267.1 integrase [Pseudomonas amygdali pv. aesculi]
MALVGKRDGRNFGYGRQLSYAGPQALKDMFGGGHYGTVKAHTDRWQAFVRWCRSEDGPGFNDARKIDRQTLLDYAGYLRQQVEHGELAIATAQNRLSSVNRTLAALRGDQYVRVASPSKALGMQRTSVRTMPPQGQDRDHVKRIVNILSEHLQPRAAAIAQLARATGMRLREAILADLPRLRREAERYGKINIQDGTKGGRSGASASRWIWVDNHIREALKYAEQVSLQRLFQDLEVNIEIKNQARVHLWYSQRFGGSYPQLQSAKEGIDRYLIAGTCIGWDVETGEVYAPNGLADTEQGLLRINPKNPKPDLFYQKAKSYQARWP